MEFDPNTALLAVLTSGIGYLMVAAGIHKSMLEWRRSARLCPELRACDHRTRLQL